MIGAGITGAIIADRLLSDGHDVVAVDSRDVACGSTSASTALIQYEIDTPLGELATLYGERSAVTAYQACLEAVGQIARLDASVGGKGFFVPRPSFYHASRERDVTMLREEYELRARHGFPVELWDAGKIAQHFDFAAPLGIFSHAGGELDPHALTHALLARVAQRGAVFDRSAVARVDRRGESSVVTMTSGEILTCRHVVVAAGYESLKFLPSVRASLHSTYALVSETLEEFPGWYERCLIWETARPYAYLRTTNDNRLLAGGEDSVFYNALTRDLLLKPKLRKIEAAVRRRFPRLNFTVDFGWTGTFAETFDGLPFIGRYPEREGMSFALCYGGNGITYSAIAADLIAADLSGKVQGLSELMGFQRGK